MHLAGLCHTTESELKGQRLRQKIERTENMILQIGNAEVSSRVLGTDFFQDKEYPCSIKTKQT